MAVSDSLSHIYESKQLENIIQQLETGLKQLELTQQYTDTIQTTYDKAHTNYDRAKEFYDDLMAVKEFYESTKTTWMGRYQDYQELYQALTDKDASIEDFQDLLDAAFIDPRTMDADTWIKTMDRQFDLRQLSLRDLMKSNEDTLDGMEGRVAKAQALAAQVDQTVNPKDAMDLNNRLLLEILSVLQEMMAMDSRYQQTMASLKYEGVTEDSIKTRQNRLADLEGRVKQVRWETRELAKYGLSKDSTIKEIRENPNKPKIDDIINWHQLGGQQ
ncbi:type IV secretion system protein [Pseudodesulfovibrio indicus]|uniref:type IV secretion system protein n=1 Tax=Pseudodesulfovibrio indicus TaxID=1716143 RepID=UPI00292D2133|nr:type IV secretion system protein [Pseudodesulfovibrio indicus]